MNRNLFAAAFFSGLIAVVWVALGFIGANPVALAMTVLIGAVYGFGAQELWQFRQATASLDGALRAIPQPLQQLNDWLASIHPSLQNAVRLRVEGERVALPGPALAPYLAGLLVMLGMLGTFLGMVLTFSGAAFALEGGADLQAIRSALSAPIKGLGLAFGTSVAGVAASAMLGLMSAIARRERGGLAQQLDRQIATALRGFSLAHQRQQTYQALQMQADVLPGVARQLQALMQQIEQCSQQLNERLLANQEGFHSHVQAAYTGLARSVEASLKDSVAASVRAAGESVQPVVEAAMTGMAQQAQAIQERAIASMQEQLQALMAQFSRTTQTVADTWVAALQSHEQASATLVSGMGRSMGAFTQTFEERSAALLENFKQAFVQLKSDLASGDAKKLEAWQRSLERMAEGMQGQQQQICTTLEATASGTLEQIAHLVARSDDLMQVRTESEAALLQQHRTQMQHMAERDSAAQQDRVRILQKLDALLAGVQHALAEQNAASQSLVSKATTLLGDASSQFAQQVGAQSASMEGVGAQVLSSAIEVSSLGEAFRASVQQFSEANEKLIASLQRIEASMDQSQARSDDQLAYYVAQAREIIDLSIMSQKDIVEDLRQLGAQKAKTGLKPDLLAAEAQP